MGYKTSSWVLNAEMEIETRSLQAPGRVLNPPTVIYGGATQGAVGAHGQSLRSHLLTCSL